MNKKILLTGMPRSGKTTILKNILKDVPNKTGFLTEEIKEDGERTGFKIVASNGKEVVLAGIGIKSPFKVSRYFVDINGMNRLIPELLEYKKDDILYIDEIGQMELFSEDFKRLVKIYIDSDLEFVGTISKVYDCPFTRGIINRDDTQIIEVTPENREDIFQKVRKLI